MEFFFDGFMSVVLHRRRSKKLVERVPTFIGIRAAARESMLASKRVVYCISTLHRPSAPSRLLRLGSIPKISKWIAFRGIGQDQVNGWIWRPCDDLAPRAPSRYVKIMSIPGDVDPMRLSC